MGKLTCPVRILGKTDDRKEGWSDLLSEDEDMMADSDSESDSETSSIEDLTEMEDLGSAEDTAESEDIEASTISRELDTPAGGFLGPGVRWGQSLGRIHRRIQPQLLNLRRYGAPIPSFIIHMERRHEAERRWWQTTTARALENSPEVTVRSRLTFTHWTLVLHQNDYRERLVRFFCPTSR